MASNAQNMGDKSHLDKMNEKLNSRTKYKDHVDSREAMNPNPVADGGEVAVAPQQNWQSPGIDDLLMADRRGPEPYPLIKKVFLVALLFCVCAAIAATLIYFKG